jgi:B12 binding domain
MGNENDSREAYQARVSALGRAYADALLSADEAAAEIAIREAMEAGLDTAQIDDEIIAPALWHVGDLWERGEIAAHGRQPPAQRGLRRRDARLRRPHRGPCTLMNRRPPNVVCMTSTMSAPAGDVLATIGALQRRWPSIGFVIGGAGLASRVQSRPGIDVCRRVSDAVEAVDAMIRGGGRN